MADLISNLLLEHCPEFVRVIGSLRPWEALALTVAICAALVIGNRVINNALGGTKKLRKSQKKPSALRQLLTDEEVFDAEWMNPELWKKSKISRRRVGTAHERRV